jgi:hypothetical protein
VVVDMSSERVLNLHLDPSHHVMNQSRIATPGSTHESHLSETSVSSRSW